MFGGILLLLVSFHTKLGVHISILGLIRIQIRIQAKRMISTGKLNTLLHLHFQPIDVVVFDDP